MINQKYSKIIIALCGMMIVPYLIGVCMTYEFWEMAAYLSAMIGVAVVVLPTLISYNKVGKMLKPIPIILTAILFISLVGFRYWNWKYCFYSCFVVLWPVICYFAINSITSKITSKNNIWLNMRQIIRIIVWKLSDAKYVDTKQEKKLNIILESINFTQKIVVPNQVNV